MGKKYAAFLPTTALISIASVIIICMSMGTNGWTYATLTAVSAITYGDSEVNHGLFAGRLTTRLFATPVNYDIHITCIWGSNACAWSCLSTSSARETEVKSILAGETPTFSCTPSGRSAQVISLSESRASNSVSNSKFINAGAWLSTVIFLALLITAAVLSAVLSVVNSVSSPSESYFNILGIFITNCTAAGLDVLVLLIWGIHYGVNTQNNIAIRETLVGEYLSDSSIGYSYWLLLTPFFLHGINIGLIFLREYLINSEPPETKIDIDDIADGTLVLF